MSRSSTGQQLVAEVAALRREVQALELRLRDLVEIMRELTGLVAEHV